MVDVSFLMLFAIDHSRQYQIVFFLIKDFDIFCELIFLSVDPYNGNESFLATLEVYSRSCQTCLRLSIQENFKIAEKYKSKTILN